MKQLLAILALLVTVCASGQIKEEDYICDRDYYTGHGCFLQRVISNSVWTEQYAYLVNSNRNSCAEAGLACKTPIMHWDPVVGGQEDIGDDDDYTRLEGGQYSGDYKFPRNAFYGYEQVCEGVTSYIFDNLKVIGYGAMASCTSLTGIELHQKLRQIRRGAFYNCTALTSVTYPDQLKGKVTLYPHAFRGCTQLRKIDLGFVLEPYWLQGKAFIDCPNLEEVILTAERNECAVLGGRTIPSIKLVRVSSSHPNQEYYATEGIADPFLPLEYQNAILVVPMATKTLYSSIQPWCNFDNIVEVQDYYAGIDQTPVEATLAQVTGRTIKLLVEGISADIYDISGRHIGRISEASGEFTASSAGIFILQSGRNTQKIAIR